MIPQYRTLKSKLPKYHLKKAQYRNTVKPHVPLHMPLNEFLLLYTIVISTQILNTTKRFFKAVLQRSSDFQEIRNSTTVFMNNAGTGLRFRDH